MVFRRQPPCRCVELQPRVQRLLQERLEASVKPDHAAVGRYRDIGTKRLLAGDSPITTYTVVHAESIYHPETDPARDIERPQSPGVLRGVMSRPGAIGAGQLAPAGSLGVVTP